MTAGEVGCSARSKSSQDEKLVRQAVEETDLGLQTSATPPGVTKRAYTSFEGLKSSGGSGTIGYKRSPMIPRRLTKVRERQRGGSAPAAAKEKFWKKDRRTVGSHGSRSYMRHAS